MREARRYERDAEGVRGDVMREVEEGVKEGKSPADAFREAPSVKRAEKEGLNVSLSEVERAIKERATARKTTAMPPQERGLYFESKRDRADRDALRADILDAWARFRLSPRGSAERTQASDDYRALLKQAGGDQRVVAKAYVKDLLDAREREGKPRRLRQGETIDGLWETRKKEAETALKQKRLAERRKEAAD